MTRLVRGRFLRRYKRFFADVELDDGRVVVAHCPNTGSMRTLLEPGREAWLRPARDPRRKLAWTLVLLGTGAGLALVDTSLPNRLVETAVEEGRIPELEGWGSLRREVRYGSRRSRIDLLLEGGERGEAEGPLWVEIKNVTMASTARRGRADFPDAVTLRGRKHLEELRDLALEGIGAALFLLVGRTDCAAAGIAAEIDPGYAEALGRALDAGVRVIAYGVELAPERLAVSERLAFEAP